MLYADAKRNGISVAIGVVHWCTSEVINIQDIKSVLALWNGQAAWDTPTSTLVSF